MKKIIFMIVGLLVISGIFSAQAEEGQIGLVWIEQASNIRESAANTSEIAGKTKGNEFFPCFGSENGWYLIHGNDGVVGYVSEKRCKFFHTGDLSADKNTPVLADIEWQSAETGDIVLFGHYEQDNNSDNGEEPIEWIVLSKDETDNSILLITRYGIERRHFHTSNTPVVWEKSGLREWLNYTFLRTAFSKEERKMIRLTWLNADPNTQYNVNCGNKTVDFVFLLSIAEVQQYMEQDTMLCVPTLYSIAHNSSYDMSTGCCWWWLRTAGHDRMHTSYVNGSGEVSAYGYGVISDRGVVRPAMWVSFLDK